MPTCTETEKKESIRIKNNWSKLYRCCATQSIFIRRSGYTTIIFLNKSQQSEARINLVMIRKYLGADNQIISINYQGLPRTEFLTDQRQRHFSIYQHSHQQTENRQLP